ncbi:Mitogen-activated protein kinase kinase kinase YODA [Acorus calamus]|uniref:mitogen-activated protein kinase kinase kinase n=1 Tax=Acorus calamus TaxID=4465 RepID=A0AAV9DGV8_ACOCL|nr:Mitogen-activated protein kinase kinase kinase YODA [Acorus calamus]
MPPWWGRRRTKSTATERSKRDEENPQSPSSIKARHQKEKTKSFDEAFAAKNPVKNNNNVVGSGFVFAFESDGPPSSGRGRRDLPLPRPSDSAAAAAAGSGSGSVSSVSSSESSCEAAGAETGLYRYSSNNTPRGRSGKPESQRHHLAEERREISVSPRREIHLNSPDLSPRANGYRASTETMFDWRSRSPVPGTRSRPVSMSPIHLRSSRITPESTSDRQGDLKSQGHPLPPPPPSPTSPPSPPLKNHGVNENGQILRSKWRKGKLLGRGTFGYVYVGFNSENGQMCAIKEVKDISDDQASKESLRQLNQEIVLLSQLSHPNIVQYYGSELIDDTLSVYLEYVSGGSIHKLLQDYGPFREPVIRSYTGQILSGLAYLHGRNHVHRDIKGANILVDPNGSPYWMAPEVIMNGNGYNLAVDIWSLGCTILEMVAAIFKIGNSREIPEIPDHISKEAKNFLKLCLQRDPSARPTAAQLLEHPFVRDQVTVKVPRNVSNTLPTDGNRTPHFGERENKLLITRLTLLESTKAIRTVT